MHYMKYGRQLKGLSNKQIKRVLNMAKVYIYKDDKIWVKRKGKNLEVPKPDERREIIMRAHLLGHFQKLSTYHRLKDKYFWKNMLEEIEKAIRKCENCIRNQKTNEVNNPANSLRVIGIFDLIGIDLIFGLPETKEGYIGIMVITEYLTKFPYAKPIRSKTMEEIAAVLLEYISLFGPPKSILSDQGNEFNNQLMKKLTFNIGVEHRVTSAYNPRTNGQTERFNQTLVNALRKHAELNNQLWNAWLPYVLLAYRSRVHSSTKFTPFELMFGREMNTFENWSNRLLPNEEAALINRGNEIRELVERTQPDAVQNIEKQQEKQEKIQNNAHNVDQTPLSSGQSVYVKNDGLLTKLEPRYRGPYTVIKQTATGNYKLKDATGEAVKFTVPRHKIKKVENLDNEKESFEVEKILDHKEEADGSFKYLVKWKNNDESENSWVKDSDFDSKKLINKYWEEKDRNQGRRTRSKKGLNKINYLFSILAFLSLIFSTFAQEIEDRFKFCETGNSLNIVNIDKMCLQLDKNRQENRELYAKILSYAYKVANVENDTLTLTLNGATKSTYLYIYGRLVHSVYGTGHQCSMSALIVTTSMSFFGVKYQSAIQQTAKLTEGECRNMVLTKRCQRNQMKCDGEYCSFEAIPNFEFSWLSTKSYTDYSCTIKPRVISASSENERVFGTKCVIKDKKCELHDSIIIWDNEIIHRCPLYEISNTLFKIKGFFLWNEREKLGFQFEKFVNVCNAQVIQTTEGLFLSRFKINDAQRTPPVNGEIKEITNMLLADEDFARIEAIEARNKIILQQCVNLKNNLRLLEKMEDEFLITEDYNKNEIVFFSNHGNVYKPRCAKVNSIEILTNTSTCTRDIAVNFNYNNATLFGFLNVDGIIRRTSNLINCSQALTFIPLRNTNKTIVRKTNRIFLVNNSILNYDDFSYDGTILAREDLTHTKLLIDSVDEISNLMQLIDNEYKIEKWEPPENNNKDQATTNLFADSKISNIINSAWLKATVLGLIILAIMIVMLVAYIIIHLNVLKCIRRYKKTKSRPNQEEEIEMKNWKLNKRQKKVVKNLPSARGETSNFLDMD